MIFITKLKIMSYTKEQVETAVKSKGYVWFEDSANKGYDVNIVGIRNSATGDKVTNVFDDHLTISYKENGEWKFHIWQATTDPGKKGVMEYHNKDGVARLVEGQYRGSHIIRLHQGKYEALGQDKPVKVYRDANKDMTYDESGARKKRRTRIKLITFIDNKEITEVKEINEFPSIFIQDAKFVQKDGIKLEIKL